MKLSQREALEKLAARSSRYLGWWELPFPTPALMDMVKAGWCDVSRAGPGNTQNYYKITEAGITALESSR